MEISTVFVFFHGIADWDEANKVKVLLEEKQRAARRRREQEAADAAAQGSQIHISSNSTSSFSHPN